jgi:hypothetical protein
MAMGVRKKDENFAFCFGKEFKTHPFFRILLCKEQVIFKTKKNTTISSF